MSPYLPGNNAQLLINWALRPTVQLFVFGFAIVLALGWSSYAFFEMRRQFDITTSIRESMSKLGRPNFALPLRARPATASELFDQGMLLKQLEVQSHSLRIEVGRITISAATKVTNQRARTEILLSLRGPYASIKELLKDLLDRHSNLGLVNIDVAQIDRAQGAEAEVSVLWIEAALEPPVFEPPDMAR